ncbi:hypothetical protein PF010_g19655 [Phytophthora fragariae]|uniref:Uncharacterized protein n=3 Tax=Phytophthora fragariae TaxID=53985 RepID=A0A6A3E871_9STRA|nr:hypothetical protein PF003_g3164 [Phytophthora fragariae]KAE8928663.1 hypothetical protein PF009_g21200 [Phytophthora fragariae]KAE8977700.1 hypothetical protein PF011_g23548 [Phytophthora fragariae]KAE9081815.1 hypothetical protein PF007_g22517 [Phytophthora fragariae]KAE9087643.1 hypothetical protein PF010_g19655 [Phytophthora fragariae]
MALNEAIKMEGDLTLDGIRYKYSIQLKEERMGIWLKSLGSGKQWYKGGMEKADYVTPANAIAVFDALPPTDYVEFIRDALEFQSSDVHRKITSMEGDRVRLELTMDFRVLCKKWLFNFKFDLESVSTDRFDLLTLKVRDQQNELRRMKERESILQRELAELRNGSKATHTAPFILLQASKRDSMARLQWEKVESEDFIMTDEGNVVKICQLGVYTVGVCMSGISKGSGAISLLKNGYCTHQVKTAVKSLGTAVTTPLALTAQFDKDDKLSIMCYNCPPSGTSYLSIARLSIPDTNPSSSIDL